MCIETLHNHRRTATSTLTLIIFTHAANTKPPRPPPQVNDGVLSLLQDASAIGLARYPERLGQLLVVNVSGRAAQSRSLYLAARALGLGAAIDAGRLRVLSGELPKWAPELLKVRKVEVLGGVFGDKRCWRGFGRGWVLVFFRSFFPSFH